MMAQDSLRAAMIFSLLLVLQLVFVFGEEHRDLALKSRLNDVRRHLPVSARHQPPPPPTTIRGGEKEGSSAVATKTQTSTDKNIAASAIKHVRDKKSERSKLEVAQTLAAPLAVSDRVDDVRAAARKWKRKEFFVLLLARVSFIVLLPFSAVFFILSVALSILMIAFRILTLNFCFRETSRIMISGSKAFLSIIFACLTGVFLPVFALFGMVAAVAEAICEVAEPILRIRYQRQLKKLRHLQKILTDPVLMETMEYLLRGAEAVSNASINTYQKVEKRSRFSIGAGKVKYQEIQDNSVQLIEMLLESPELKMMKDGIESKMPERLSSWTKDQWESLRKSGVLEDAARAAIHALKNELKSAATFLPYLEAIKEVREKQIKSGAAL
mmetsp:Transcript_4755/g.6176  ORF Transcript_4755/g.6176 Transcript_4755/m.6176 type:complete len:384 (+) Transcript_4755:11-1162(+)